MGNTYSVLCPGMLPSYLIPGFTKNSTNSPHPQQPERPGPVGTGLEGVNWQEWDSSDEEQPITQGPSASASVVTGQSSSRVSGMCTDRDSLTYGSSKYDDDELRWGSDDSDVSCMEMPLQMTVEADISPEMQQHRLHSSPSFPESESAGALDNLVKEFKKEREKRLKPKPGDRQKPKKGRSRSPVTALSEASSDYDDNDSLTFNPSDLDSEDVRETAILDDDDYEDVYYRAPSPAHKRTKARQGYYRRTEQEEEEEHFVRTSSETDDQRSMRTISDQEIAPSVKTITSDEDLTSVRTITSEEEFHSGQMTSDTDIDLPSSMQSTSDDQRSADRTPTSGRSSRRSYQSLSDRSSCTDSYSDEDERSIQTVRDVDDQRSFSSGSTQDDQRSVLTVSDQEDMHSVTSYSDDQRSYRTLSRTTSMQDEDRSTRTNSDEDAYSERTVSDRDEEEEQTEEEQTEEEEGHTEDEERSAKSEDQWTIKRRPPPKQLEASEHSRTNDFQEADTGSDTTVDSTVLVHGSSADDDSSDSEWECRGLEQTFKDQQEEHERELKAQALLASQTDSKLETHSPQHGLQQPVVGTMSMQAEPYITKAQPQFIQEGQMAMTRQPQGDAQSTVEMIEPQGLGRPQCRASSSGGGEPQILGQSQRGASPGESQLYRQPPQSQIASSVESQPYGHPQVVPKSQEVASQLQPQTPQPQQQFGPAESQVSMRRPPSQTTSGDIRRQSQPISEHQRHEMPENRRLSEPEPKPQTRLPHGQPEPEPEPQTWGAYFKSKLRKGSDPIVEVTSSWTSMFTGRKPEPQPEAKTEVTRRESETTFSSMSWRGSESSSSRRESECSSQSRMGTPARRMHSQDSQQGRRSSSESTTEQSNAESKGWGSMFKEKMSFVAAPLGMVGIHLSDTEQEPTIEPLAHEPLLIEPEKVDVPQDGPPSVETAIPEESAIITEQVPDASTSAETSTTPTAETAAETGASKDEEESEQPSQAVANLIRKKVRIQDSSDGESFDADSESSEQPATAGAEGAGGEQPAVPFRKGKSLWSTIIAKRIKEKGDISGDKVGGRVRFDISGGVVSRQVDGAQESRWRVQIEKQYPVTSHS